MQYDARYTQRQTTALPLDLYRCKTLCISATKVQQLWAFCDKALGKHLDLKVKHQQKDQGENTVGVLLFVVPVSQGVRQGRGKKRRMRNMINYTKVYSGGLNGSHYLGDLASKNKTTGTLILKKQVVRI